MTLDLPQTGSFVGRVWQPDVAGPVLVVRRDDRLVDITSRGIPTMQALLSREDPAGVARAADGTDIGSLADIAGNSTEAPDGDLPFFLAPSDNQPIKACGVTFATSMLERLSNVSTNGTV